MKTYQVTTVTSKRVITEDFGTIEGATEFFRIAIYGYPEGEYVEKIYLTEDNVIIATLTKE